VAAPRLPILFVGAGNLGGALIAGWRRSGMIPACDMILRDPHPGSEALAAARAGARLNVPDNELAEARTVLFAVKPQVWRNVAQEITPHLAPDALILSVVAGISSVSLAGIFGSRPIGRLMPTLASAIGHGAVSFWAPDADICRQIADLCQPLGSAVQLEDEALMHAATAAVGSAPAYLYAFIEALESAGAKAGLPPDAAAALARASIAGAAALLSEGQEDPAELRRQVTSPGGTTEAALSVLSGPGGLGPLLDRAVAAATARSRELGA
jgi:pyrroline-5-carboxylate reductase